jgi:hypothetical protein
MDARRHFRTKRKEFMKNKINELAVTYKNKNIETCIEGSVNIGRVTKPELTW